MIISRRLVGVALAATAPAWLVTPAAAQNATRPQTSALSRESVIETIRQAGVIRIGLSLFRPGAMRDKSG